MAHKMLMRGRPGLRGTLAILLAMLIGCSNPPPKSTTLGPRAEVEAQMVSLERRRTTLEDINDIKRLQRAFGYYMDVARWDDVANLFSDNGTVEYGLDGVYRGKRRVREYFYALGGGKAGLAPGQVSEHFQVMPVIDVAPDGRSAKGTWRAVVLTGGGPAHDAFWSEGPFEKTEYAKVNGVWKISALHWVSNAQSCLCRWLDEAARRQRGQICFKLPRTGFPYHDPLQDMAQWLCATLPFQGSAARTIDDCATAPAFNQC